MIKTELIMEGDIQLIHTWSDTYTIKLVETGIEYIDAIDILNKYTYIETNTLL